MNNPDAFLNHRCLLKASGCLLNKQPSWFGKKVMKTKVWKSPKLNTLFSLKVISWNLVGVESMV